MNPQEDKPYVPTPPPVDATNDDQSIPSAGDAAALQAIEALEAESNGLVTEDEPIKPVIPAAPITPISFRPTMTQPPVTVEPTTPTISPISHELSDPSPALSSSAEPPSISPIAASLNDSLKDESAVPTKTDAFQPFAEPKKSPKKMFVILVSVIVALALGVGGYFGWQYLESQKTPVPVQSDNSETPAPSATIDDPETVNGDIETIETDLENIDDSNYQDSTLSDASLYN